jgi:hypothetical protein
MATLRRCFSFGRASRKAFDKRMDQLLFKPVCCGGVHEKP